MKGPNWSYFLPGHDIIPLHHYIYKEVFEVLVWLMPQFNGVENFEHDFPLDDSSRKTHIIKVCDQETGCALLALTTLRVEQLKNL